MNFFFNNKRAIVFLTIICMFILSQYTNTPKIIILIISIVLFLIVYFNTKKNE